MSKLDYATSSGAHRTDKDASSNQDPHGEFSIPMSTYWIVFALLMIFLIITVVAAFIPLGVLNMPVAMAIATFKATLVVLYFMHVKFASRLTKVFVAASVLWLGIMFVMTFFDYFSRDMLSNSKGWSESPVKRGYEAGAEQYHQDHGTAADQNVGGKHEGDPAAGETKQAQPGNEGESHAPGKPGAE